MSSDSPINTLSPEVLLLIASHLNHGSCFEFMQVSKNIHQIIEPRVWHHLEFHRPDYHEDYSYEKYHQPPPTRSGTHTRSSPPYDSTVALQYGPIEDFDIERYYNEKAQLFLKRFERNFPGSDRLASLVSSLCLSVDLYEDDGGYRNCWNALTKFISLEYLEVHAKGNYFNDISPFNPGGTAPLMKNLKTVKLKGYIPAYFVEHITRSPSQISTLELSILDVPIGGTRCSVRQNPPGSPYFIPEDYDGMTDAEVEALDDIEDMDHEEICPRPLACLPPTVISQFSSITYLWLCKPSNPYESIEKEDQFADEYYSGPADIRAYIEWKALLTAVKGTLRFLGLEHRPTTHSIEADGTGSAEFLVYRRGEGPSYRRFIEGVLPTLVEKDENGTSWKNLMEIWLCGFEHSEVDCRECVARRIRCDGFRDENPLECQNCLRSSRRCPGPQQNDSAIKYPSLVGGSIRRTLEARFPDARVVIELGRRMLYEPDDGAVVLGGDVLGGQIIGEDGEEL